MGSSHPAWTNDRFDELLTFIGDGPVIVSWISLIAGIGYLVWAEVDSFKPVIQKNLDEIKENWNEDDN